MSDDILKTAREVLRLAEGPTTAAPWTQDECVQFDVNGPAGDPILDGHALAQTQLAADAEFIAFTRTAAPQLAQAIVSVDEMTSRLLGLYEPREATSAEVETACDVIRDVRRRLGLPSSSLGESGSGEGGE